MAGKEIHIKSASEQRGVCRNLVPPAPSPLHMPKGDFRSCPLPLLLAWQWQEQSHSHCHLLPSMHWRGAVWGRISLS